MKKLKKILLINWLYFSKELIEVGDINFLTGKNGAGKSTVIDALQIVLLGETNSRNFNQAANEKSQRTLEGYLRADMDDIAQFIVEIVRKARRHTAAEDQHRCCGQNIFDSAKNIHGSFGM